MTGTPEGVNCRRARGRAARRDPGLGRDHDHRRFLITTHRGDKHGHRIHRLSPADPLGRRRHQPHPVHGLHRGRPASKEARSPLLPSHWCYVGLEAEIPNAGRLQAHGGRRALGHHGARRRRRASTSSRTSARTAACSSAASGTATGRRRLHLPLPPVELHARRRPAGRAVSPRRQAGRQGQRRHAGRLQARRPRPQQAQGRDARRRRLRVVRPRRRIARGLHRPGRSSATSIACSTAAS